MREIQVQHAALMALDCWAPADSKPVLPHAGFGGSPDPFSLRVFSQQLNRDEKLLSQGTATVPELDNVTVQRLGFPGLGQLPRKLAARSYGELFVTTTRVMYFSLPFLARAQPNPTPLMPFVWKWKEIGAYELAESPGLAWLPAQDQPPWALTLGFMAPDAPPLGFYMGTMLAANVAAAAQYYVAK